MRLGNNRSGSGTGPHVPGRLPPQDGKRHPSRYALPNTGLIARPFRRKLFAGTAQGGIPAQRQSKAVANAQRYQRGRELVICIFGVTYRDDIDWDLNKRLNEEMAEVVVTMPGFISLKFYEAKDGDQIGIIRFRNREDLKAWRDHQAHRGAWNHAPKLYHEFWVQNCVTFDDYVWIDGVHHDRDQTDRFRMSKEEVLGAFAATRP